MGDLLLPKTVVKRKTSASRKKEVIEPPLRVQSHVFVSKHEILSGEEKQEVLARSNATPELFPYLLTSDPMAREIEVKPGDLVKVTRKSETAGEAIYYRFVVEG